MAELSALRVSLASQIAEAERILTATKERMPTDPGRSTAEQRLTLAKREAIVMTLTRVNNGEETLRA